MANEGLRRQRDDLRSQLNDIERQNKIIAAEIAAIVAAIVAAKNQIANYQNDVSNRLNAVDSSIEHSHQTLINSLEIEQEIEEMYRRFKNMETANKTLRDLKDKEMREFDIYNKSRKLVCGMLENISTKFVEDKTIHKAIEISHLESHNYWLTYCLLAIMAWRNSNKKESETAIKQALNLDKKSTSLFFMIFHMRIARGDIALKWFSVFKNCDFKGQDSRAFLMLLSLLDETLQEDIDQATKDEVKKFINNILEKNKKSSDYSEEDALKQINDWWGKSQPNKDLGLPVLSKHIADVNTMHYVLMRAINNTYILDFIKKLSNISVEERNDFYNKYIVELIYLPCKEEDEVFKEMKKNEMILDYEGRKEEAIAAFEDEIAWSEGELNFIREMIEWIYDVDNPDVNDQIRLNLYRLTKDLQKKAYDNYHDDYKKQYSEKYDVNINDYKTNMNFNNFDKECSKVDEYYNEQCQGLLSTIKTWPSFIGLGVAVASGIGCFYAGFWLLIFTVLGCVFAGGWLSWVSLKKLKIRRKFLKIAEECKDIVKKLFDEFKQYKERFDKYDKYSDEIKTSIEAI